MEEQTKNVSPQVTTSKGNRGIFVLAIFSGFIISIVSFVLGMEYVYFRISNSTLPTSKINQASSKPSSSNVVKSDTLRLISPNGGETFCLGQDMQIKWNASHGVRSVTLIVQESSGLLSNNNNTIGTFPATYNSKNNGEGLYVWKIGNVVANGQNVIIPLQDSPAYEIHAVGLVQNSPGVQSFVYADTKNLFTIKDCAAKPSETVFPTP